MKAVTCRGVGGLEVLEITDLPEPVPRADELLVRNFATALNRADLLQRRGLYPPPPGESEILGLEFAGEVAAFGAEVEGFSVGDRVFGLIAGGGYAEFVTVQHKLAVRIPDQLSYDAAAAVPEAFYTAGDVLFSLGELKSGETVVVHAAASGVGTAAVQLACTAGARVVATAGTPQKLELCKQLGADVVVNYREQDFAGVTQQACGGADVVLDLVGASHFEQNMRVLREGGRLLVIGLVSGGEVELNLAAVLKRRLRIVGSTMRNRTLGEKIEVTSRFLDRDLPRFVSGELKPLIDRVFPLEEVRAAHQRMEQNENAGKIVLRM